MLALATFAFSARLHVDAAGPNFMLNLQELGIVKVSVVNGYVIAWDGEVCAELSTATSGPVVSVKAHELPSPRRSR